MSDNNNNIRHNKKILVTGGTGFIGSHCVVSLVEKGYQVVIVDNLDNSNKIVLKNIEEITGKAVEFYICDVRNTEALDLIFKKAGPINCVLHCAALKAVGDSVKDPLGYYDCNVSGTINLLQVMQNNNCHKIIFSSSATVYGDAPSPMNENSSIKTFNPYGRTKRFIERILEDVTNSKNGEQWQIVSLRYFNPCGAHESGLIGEDPLGIPNNLMPYLQRVISGRLPHLNVFGNDYNTKDGTGVRDYIHVMDLAEGHVAAIDACFLFPEVLKERFEVFNLGSGHGYSVLELVKALEKASKKEIKLIYTNRRPGDIDLSYADPSKANKLLKWKTVRNLDEICRDVCSYLTQCGYLK